MVVLGGGVGWVLFDRAGCQFVLDRDVFGGEQPVYEGEVAVRDSDVEWTPAVRVLGSHFGIVRDEVVDHVGLTKANSVVEWFLVLLIFDIDGRILGLEQGFNASNCFTLTAR